MPEMYRVTRTKEKAKTSYDRMCKWYDVFGYFEKSYRNTGLQKLDAKEGEIVLEIGFGTGHCILALARSVGDSGKVYGIDISEGMCGVTQSRVKKAGLSKRVSLTCSDVARLPYESNFFDAVFMSFTLDLFDTSEIPILLRECKRVLHSDGRICVVALSKKDKVSVITKIYEFLHKKFPTYIDCRPIFVQKILEEVGFRICDVKEMFMWGLPVEIVAAKKI